MSDGDLIPFQALERPPTLSDRVTQSVLDLINSAALKPGDRLPSERDLGERFGVSRTVVREALRSLAAKGVLDVRSGSGATVARVNVEHASETLRLYVQGSHGGAGGVTYEQVNDVREMIETRVAQMAATSASAEDIARLVSIHEEFCARSEDPEPRPNSGGRLGRALRPRRHHPVGARHREPARRAGRAGPGQPSLPAAAGHRLVPRRGPVRAAAAESRPVRGFHRGEPLPP